MTGPGSEDLEALLHEALSRPLPWWQRLMAAIRRLPSWVARDGGYWGGVIMVLRRAGARAAAFLRR